MKIFSEFIAEANRKAQRASKSGRTPKEGSRSKGDDKPKGVVTVGLPGSGKSTIAKHMVSKGNTDQHELDKSRQALGKGPAYFGQDIVQHTYSGAKKSAKQGRSTVLSNTSIPKQHRQDAIDKLKDAGYENVKAVLSPGSTKAAMRRNRKRTGSKPGEGAVPQFVMNRMAQGMKSMSRAERRKLRGNYKELHKSERFTKPAMKRSGAIREAKVSAKTFEEFINEARRMRVLRTAHYTSPENKKEIMTKGFKDSPSSGTYHPQGKSVVYTTPSSRVGNDYGTRPVNLRIVNPKIHSTDSPKGYRSKLKSWMRDASDEDLVKDKNRPTDPRKQSKSAIESGKKIVRVPNAHENPMRKVPRGSYIMVNKEVANKSIDRNPQPTIKSKDKKRRTQTQPKKR
jgi:predicted kinase